VEGEMATPTKNEQPGFISLANYFIFNEEPAHVKRALRFMKTKAERTRFFEAWKKLKTLLMQIINKQAVPESKEALFFLKFSRSGSYKKVKNEVIKVGTMLHLGAQDNKELAAFDELFELASKSLAIFLSDEKNIPKLKKCKCCDRFFVAQRVNEKTKCCSDKCREGYNNRRRIESGESAAYKREIYGWSPRKKEGTR
jgi:hypothetical protein